MLEVEPDQLTFRRPFTKDVVKCPLQITNKSQSTALVFKIKTTAPKTYCVRPNAGLLQPRETRSINVLLQPMDDEPPEDFKCRDKFLVLGVAVSERGAQLIKEAPASADVWQLAEANKVVPTAPGQESTYEKKMRVVFLSASGGGGETSPVASNSTTTTAAVAPVVPMPSVTSMMTTQETKQPSSSAVPSTPVHRNSVVAASDPSNSSSKLSEKLREKEEEVKRLQALCAQYKSKLSTVESHSNSSSSTGSWLFIIVVAVLAYLIGQYYAAGANSIIGKLVGGASMRK